MLRAMWMSVLSMLWRDDGDWERYSYVSVLLRALMTDMRTGSSVSPPGSILLLSQYVLNNVTGFG